MTGNSRESVLCNSSEWLQRCFAMPVPRRVSELALLTFILMIPYTVTEHCWLILFEPSFFLCLGRNRCASTVHTVHSQQILLDLDNPVKMLYPLQCLICVRDEKTKEILPGYLWLLRTTTSSLSLQSCHTWLWPIGQGCQLTCVKVLRGLL